MTYETAEDFSVLETPTEAGDAREIFELLLVGEKIEVIFLGPKAFETFRVRLYQIKKSTTQRLVELGMMNEDDVQSLIFDPMPIDAPNPVRYQVYLGKRKREAMVYRYRIVTTE